MNGRVLPFAGRAHTDVERMLPWYANGTLDADDAERVRLHLLECAACREELSCLRTIMDVVLPVETAREADRDWLRLRDRLNTMRNDPATPLDLRRIRQGWQSTPAWLQVALAAQCAFIAVLAAFLFRAPEPASFTTLSATASRDVAHDTLLVVFDPRITDAQLRELLGAHHARIVDGPNATGAYLVATPPGQAEVVRHALRASPGVSMAERLAPPE